VDFRAAGNAPPRSRLSPQRITSGRDLLFGLNVIGCAYASLHRDTSGPAFTRTLWHPPPGPPDFGDLTFFAGQPDPADGSHFTIDYQTPAGRGKIDGWLQPDDTIKFQVTSGPLAR